MIPRHHASGFANGSGRRDNTFDMSPHRYDLPECEPWNDFRPDQDPHLTDFNLEPPCRFTDADETCYFDLAHLLSG